MTTHHQATTLRDDELLLALRQAVRASATVLARVLAYLGEVDARRLYLAQACSSLFAFCMQRLGFDEARTYRHIAAVRLVRRFPLVLEYVADERLHLTALGLLSPHLTEENHRELLDAASGKSKREIERMLADHKPKPAAPDSIRKLPSPSPAKSSPQLALPVGPSPESGALPLEHRPAATSPTPKAATASTPGLGGEPGQAVVSATAPAPSPAAPAAPALATIPATTASATIPASSTGASSPLPSPKPFEPLGQERYKISFTAPEALVQKLQHAQALLSHRKGGCDLAGVVAQAVDLLCDKLEKERFGSPLRKPARKAPAQGADPAPADPCGEPRRATAPCAGPAEGAEPEGSSGSEAGASCPSRYIPKAIRREVVERDGARCTFVDELGQRCTETRFLELHHDGVPFGRGGAHTADNLRIVCGPHNRFLARQEYGDRHVDRRIAESRKGGRSQAPETSSHRCESAGRKLGVGEGHADRSGGSSGACAQTPPPGDPRPGHRMA